MRFFVYLESESVLPMRRWGCSVQDFFIWVREVLNEWFALTTGGAIGWLLGYVPQFHAVQPTMLGCGLGFAAVVASFRIWKRKLIHERHLEELLQNEYVEKMPRVKNALSSHRNKRNASLEEEESYVAHFRDKEIAARAFKKWKATAPKDVAPAAATINFVEGPWMSETRRLWERF